MFNENYAYRGSMSETMCTHFRSLSHRLQIVDGHRKPNLEILEIGSNDGVFIKNWDTTNVVAVEPCGNFAEETQTLGYTTYAKFWTTELAETIKKEHGKRDIIFI